MKNYHRLTLKSRYQIKALKDSGFSIRSIATTLKVSPSTISREFKRNLGKYYQPEKAQSLTEGRRINIGPAPKVTGDIQGEIIRLLNLQWSPEQISGRLSKRRIHISHETIYKYIYWNYSNGGNLFLNLRRRRKRRRTKQAYIGLQRCGLRVNQSWIEERPRVVERRIRLGDFERDCVLGKNGRLLTIVDRKSKLTKIAKMDKHNSFITHVETIRLLQNFKVHTITNDNGPEFGLHDQTAKELNARIYFARPYCSWQRGTSENTNGLIRQYYPKGTDFSLVSSEEIIKTEELLNNRPRKALGYLTPNEVHHR